MDPGRGRTRLTVDGPLLAELAAEARLRLQGLELRHVAPAVGGGLTLLFAAPGADRLEAALLLVDEPGRARLHLVPLRPEDRRIPPDERSLRAAELFEPTLRGRTLVGIEALPRERRVVLEFSPPDLRVAADLGGPAPAIALVGADGVVRAASRTRRGRFALAPGLPLPPPPPAGRSPAEVPPSAKDHPLSADFPRSAGLDEALRPLDLEAHRRGLFLRARNRLRRELRAAERLLEKLRDQREGERTARRLRREADLIGVHYTRLPAEGGRVVLTDPIEGGAVEIVLEPGLRPDEWIAARHRRARALERSARGAAERLPAVEKERARLIRALEDLDRREERGESPPPVEEPAPPSPPRSESSGRRSRRRRLPPGVRVVELGEGIRALVGGDARANDALVTRIAHAGDAWLHAEGTTGAHVILRIDSGRPPSPEELLDGAALAAYFSPLREAERVQVTWCFRRDLRKVKGLGPGRVLLTRRRTLTLRRPLARARRLLGLDAP